MSSRLVDITCTVVHKIDGAVLVKSEDTGCTAWVPKSVCEFAQNNPDRAPPAEGVLTPPEQWAIDKLLV
jgi:hypothetical protein